MATNRKVLQLAGSSYASIQTLSGAEALQGRELLVSIDTKELVLGNADGTSTVIGSVFLGTTADKGTVLPVTGRQFFDTDLGSLFIGNGTEWVIASSVVDLSGHILKVAGGTEDNLVALTADGSVKDAGVKFNDAGQTATDIWSAEKITQAITDAVNGLSWQKPVKTVALEPDDTPALGDRFLITGGTATGDFTGKEDSIAEFDGEEWTFYTPVDGAAVYAQDTDEQYAYNGTEWVLISSAFTFTAGNGISLLNNVISVKVKENSGVVVTVDGVAAKIDEVSIVFDANGALSVGSLDFGTF